MLHHCEPNLRFCRILGLESDNARSFTNNRNCSVLLAIVLANMIFYARINSLCFHSVRVYSISSKMQFSVLSGVDNVLTVVTPDFPVTPGSCISGDPSTDL